MAFRLYKSVEGEKEYVGTGQKYPDHIQDQLFEHHCNLIQGDPNKREIINAITRVKRYDNSEWLTYNETSIGNDSVYGRRHVFYRSSLGKYIKLDKELTRIPNAEIMNNPNMSMEFDINDKVKDASKASMFKETVNITGEREEFSVPFTKANLDKLHSKCVDKSSKREEITSYSVAKESGIEVLVTGGYDQFKNTDFSTLFVYGCSPTKEERMRVDSITSNRFRQSSPAVLAATAEEANGMIGVAIV